MQILRIHSVRELTGLSRTTIWRLERQGRFPTRFQLSENAVGWDKDEVLKWVNSRPRGLSGAPPQLQGEAAKAAH